MTEKEKEKAQEFDEARKEENLKALCIATGLMMTAVTTVVPTRAPMVLKIKKGDVAATAKAMGLMTTCAGIMELFINPVLGKLSDEYGRKPFLLLAPTVNAFLHTLVAAFPGVLAMQFLDRMISGMFIFGFVAPAQAAMADLFASNPANLGAKVAHLMTFFGVGCTLGPYLGSKLQGARSFFGSAIGFVITWLWVNAKFKETLPEANRKKFKLSDVNPVACLKLFKTKTLSLLTCTAALQSFGDYVNIYDINNLFMIKVLGYGQSQIGNFATTVGLTQIAGGIANSKMIKTFGLKSTTLMSNLIWILGMAMMGTARNTKQALFALAIWTFGHNRANPVNAYMQKYGAAEGMGRAEIVGANGNALAYAKIMIPLLYSNVFAWATSNGRNMPGLPYFVICALTGLSQFAFQNAGCED